MTERTKIVSDLIQRWKERLCIVHWEIRWEWSEFDDSTMGEATIIGGRENAKLVFDINIYDWTDLRHAVIHELVHCAMGRTLKSVETLQSSGTLSVPVFNAWHQQFREIHEVDIDRVTNAFEALAKDADLQRRWKKSKVNELSQ